jgi:hypothetical protein
MRWLRASKPRPVSEPLELVDTATLEVIELDTDGRLQAPAATQRGPDLFEIGYAPRRRDATGVAGLWEAVTAS